MSHYATEYATSETEENYMMDQGWHSLVLAEPVSTGQDRPPGWPIP